MPDFTTEYYYHCLSQENFETEVKGSKGKTYTVKHGREHKNRGECEVDWSCDCPAYKFKPGYCKHIKAVQESGDFCGWMQFFDGGEVEHDTEGTPICPECGGPVTSLGWSV